MLNQGKSITFGLSGIALQEGSSISIASPPAHGQVSLMRGSLAVYLPDPAYFGNDEFTYKLTQPGGKTEFYRISLTILRIEPASTEINSVELATWKGNKKSAYSITHDDLCSGPLDQSGLVAHWRELQIRGLAAGFGAIVGLCEYEPQYYPAMREMEAGGMEIINHSFTHPGPGDGYSRALLTPGIDWNHELNESDATLRANGIRNISYFVFPYDLANDDLLREVQAMGYLGARGGRPKTINSKDMNGLDELAPFRANFDCLNSNETGEPPCSKHTGTALEVLNSYLDDGIASHGWALREMHGIGVNDSWGWVSLQTYQAHLDYVVSKINSGDVWMETPSNVTRYRAARAYCGKPSVQNHSEISFDNPGNINGCIKYATPLDVIATIDNADNITASQDGENIPVKQLGGNRFLLTINPLGGRTIVSGSDQ